MSQDDINLKEPGTPNLANGEHEELKGIVYLRSGVDVTDISGDSRCVSDIVEGETRDKRVKLHKESKRLTNSTGGAKDGDFSFGDGFGREATAEKRLLRRGRRSDDHRSEHFLG